MTEQTEAFIRPDGQPTIGMAIIAKNEAECIGQLLDSVGFTEIEEGDPTGRDFWPGGSGPGLLRPEAAVDVVVVADTGSTDETKEIAARRGCRVVEVEWQDDFSKARQASYDALPAWVNFTLWGDCDDVIEGAAVLRQLGAQMPPEAIGTLNRYDYARDDAGNTICELWRERLVRNVPGCEWKLPIHEVLQVPGALAHVEQVVWHHNQPSDRERDPERNYKILRKSFEASTASGEAPDARTTAYLGTEALGLGQAGEAVELFKLYLGSTAANGNSEERCQVAHKLSIALRALREGEKAPPKERLDASIEAGMLAIHERPDWPDGYLDLAEVSLMRDELDRALAFCDQAAQRPIPKTLLIINPLEYQYQPLLMKSVALSKLGRVEEAVEATQQALAITPYRDDLKGQYALVGRQLKEKQTTEAFLTLREILCTHDENWKAEVLMECAPYYIWGNPAVAAARLDQREMTLHATDPSVYGSYYRENPNEAPFEQTGIPIPEAHERFHRVKFLRDGLDIQADKSGAEIGKLRILDLSMNDGWMLANLADGGYGSDGYLAGMDLNRGAVERASDRLAALALPTGHVVCDNLFNAAEHFSAASFDAVVCFETIEHVPDPGALIDLMVQMTAPGGQIYVSTPEGAYEDGNVPQWANVEAKGHLRAMTAHDLSSVLLERGSIRAFAQEQKLMVARCEPRERVGKVIFFAAGAEAQPERIVTEGLGGSETALVKMAEHFAHRGFDVRVYSGKGGGLRSDKMSVEGEGANAEILYAPATYWNPGEKCDLFISLRVPEAFDRTIDAPVRLLWLHDADYGPRITPQRAERTTHIAVLSEFHRDLMVEKYPFIEDKVFLTRNGIETSFFESEPEPQRKPRLVYTSSPDRGLDVLLECWPKIREGAEAEGVKKPELHCTYAPYYREAVNSGAIPPLVEFDLKVQALIEGNEGVVAHGSMSQPDLAELYRTSMVWAYPSWASPHKEAFPEISCISALEAQAGGCVPVCLENGALIENAQGGFLIEPIVIGDKLALDWREKFIGLCVKALTNRSTRQGIRDNTQGWAMTKDWSKVADQWQEDLLPTGVAA